MTGPSEEFVVPSPAEAKERLEQALFEIRRVIAGQDAMLERVLVCLLAQGHLLIEGVPGSREDADDQDDGRRARRHRSRASSSRPTSSPPISSARASTAPARATFDTELGPVFCNFLLADEINRAPAKVQSALLEVMQERQVTIGHDTLSRCPDPFLVMATQNPIESEGTYPLPEAQVDRFMLKVADRLPGARRGADGRAAAARRGRRSCARCSRSTSSRRSRRRSSTSTSTRRSSATPSRSRPRPASPARARAARARRLHRLRRQPARADQPRPGGARARARPRPRLRARRGPAGSSRRTRSATGSCSPTRRSRRR